LNDVCVLKGSGLIFLGGEQSKVTSYFIPSLGPAPQWCSFLDNLTEELEEDSAPIVYDDYKFLTLADIQQLGATNLVGTNYLRAYMHGFFIGTSSSLPPLTFIPF
jgi:ribosome biogenesis protein ENP2